MPQPMNNAAEMRGLWKQLHFSW